MDLERRTKILVVDDQLPALEGMSRILRSAGYIILEAMTGEEALRLARDGKPYMIVLAVALPDVDGIELCKTIKSDPALAGVYVVLLSSIKAESDDQAEGLETGADGYKSRPIANRELLARIKALLRIRQLEGCTAEAFEFNWRLITTRLVKEWGWRT
jgi:DNA-binding response OmpR family regulator